MRSSPAAATRRSTSRPVPGGTVDFATAAMPPRPISSSTTS